MVEEDEEDRWELRSTEPGNPDADNVEKQSSGKKDSELSQRARDILPLANFRCPNTCQYGQNCINKITMQDFAKEREKVWGTVDSAYRTRTARGGEIQRILERAYNPNRKVFEFSVYSSIFNQFIQICEAAMLVILHLFSGSLLDFKNFHPTEQWRAARKTITGQVNAMKRPRKNPKLKFDHAFAYLERYKEKSCERLPVAPPKDHPDGVRVAPFKNIGGLFKQYEDDNKSDPLAAS